LKTAKRKPMWDRGGVSEIIGTILTLSITVVLFSGIIAMVNQFPAPGDNVYTDFTATIEPEKNWAADTGAFIHITNTGGEQMTGLWTLIVVAIDDFTLILNTQGTLNGTTYGLGPGVYGHRGSDNGDGNWDTGERWTIYRNETQISQASNVGVMVLDQERNALVWSAQIQGRSNEFGPIISNIRADSDLGSLRADPVQYGREFWVFAEVYDPDGDLDPTSVRADLSSIISDAGNATVLMTDADGDGVFVGGPLIGPDTNDVPVGYHIAVVRARDLEGRVSVGTARISVGMDLAGQPNLRITKPDISVNPKSPINGQTISVTTTVRNFGGWCNGTVHFWDIVGNNRTWKGMSNFTISQGPSQVRQSMTWTIRPGGEHRIEVNATPLNARDITPEDNVNSTNITVLPKILLVDDDNYPPDTSVMDTVGYMRGALESSDFGYDLYTVGQNKDGPEYGLGTYALQKYDVIIWMTGYEKASTLTANDQENLTAYLNGTRGNLWMIGQYLFNDSKIDGSFFSDILKVEDSVWISEGPTNPLMGVEGNPISRQWNESFIPVTTRAASHTSSYHIRPVAVGTNEEINITFREEDLNSTFGDALNYENRVKDSRIVFFPWEFSRIANTGDQTQVTYRVLKWLGNITIRHGEDLAISEQVIDPSFVFFNQVVRVDAEIRNNGEKNLTTQVGLFLDDRNDPVSWISSIKVPGQGGSVTVSANWTARELGKHVLKWRVDPNNLISETNEGNNEIPSYISSGQIFVEFRILVVDDDGSENNLGTLSNDTRLLTESLDRLGYVYESPAGGIGTTYIVEAGKDGPAIDVLKNYSSVFWITGESSSGLSANDSFYLAAYINTYKGMLWLSGDDLWSGVPPGANITADMGIDSVIPDRPLSGTLRGVSDSPISHGMNISIVNNSFADWLSPTDDAEGVFYQSYAANRFCALMIEGASYKGFTSAFTLSTLNGTRPGYISGNNATDELVYMVLHWMNKPDTRNELRITEKDYEISDAHPQIGGAYIIRATVHNVGANDANLLVRFTDGDVQIGSDSITIAPGQKTSAEIIWKPLFAGRRQISVFADPVNEVDEIFQWFNNNYTFTVYVYFFWDDMESGAGKWSHGSTIININGEVELDYMTGLTSIDTDIINAWNLSESYGMEKVANTAHSYPSSFYLHEGVGLFGKADVLISFAIDDSRSMSMRYTDDGRTWLEAAKDAALSLLAELSDDSVCVSIWDFEGNNERRWAGPTETVGGGRLQNDNVNHNMYPRPPVRLGDQYVSTINGTDIDGRQFIRDEITLLNNPPGQTIMWDAVGEAYLDTLWFAPTYPQLMPVVIVLSDGADTQASDQAPIGEEKIEGGSDYWCPWSDIDDGFINYGFPTNKYMHYGKYTFDWANPLDTTHWLESGSLGSMQRNRTGLLDAKMKIFTIGLGLEHHTNPWEPTRYTYAGSYDWKNPALTKDNLYAHYNSTSPNSTFGPYFGTNQNVYKESGTLEYNLWRIANTTGAMYFYAPSGDELEDIFTQLGMYLATGFNQTRSSEPEGTRAVHDNSDKRLVTMPFNLTDIESAKLTFWHKYNLLQGGNAAFLQVGYKLSANGNWIYKYITPPGQYTGMLYYGYTVYDDYDENGERRLIRWGWNGISGTGSFGWEYANVDISPYVPEGYNAIDGHVYRSEVCVAFNYTMFGGGTNVGWYIDDVLLVVTRAEAAVPNSASKDLWRRTQTNDSHNSKYCWSNVDPVTGFVKPGIDNYLMTAPIDLTNARTAYLSAYFRFNFNYQSGAPPDGFRVEITPDGGLTWIALNLGVRAAQAISGTGGDAGLTDSGDLLGDNYWVSSRSLGRLTVDLSAWSGNQVFLRFRLVSNNLSPGLYPHHNNYNYGSDPGFGGMYIDDVNVYGETIFG